jgi:hypothetical protein
MRVAAFVLIELALLLSGAVQAQPPIDRRDSKSLDSQRFGSADLRAFFDMSGKDVLVRSEINPALHPIFDRLAEKLGITNGRITRQQFDAYKDRRHEERGDARPSAAGNAASAMIADLKAKTMERSIPPNADNTRTSTVFRLPDRSIAFVPTKPQKTKPLVYRTTNLPKELPSWFKEIDLNQDAQISLYEWRMAGKPLAEFQRIDRNGDGFLSVDEVLSYEAARKGTSGQRTSARAGMTP